VTANERLRARFEAEHPFPLDPFQRSALDALDAGRSVLVAAVSRVLLLNLMPLCVASAVKLSFIWLELMTAPVTKVLGIVTAAAKPRDDARTATLIH